MSTMIFEVYDALKSVGVPDEKASAAARAIIGDPVTKDYLDMRLKAQEESIKSDLIKWMAAMLIAQAGAITALVKLL